MAQSQSVYVKELLEAPAAPAVPWLHERWTWEGDETPLPGKWASIQAAGGVDAGLTADWLRQHVLSSPMFDAASTFFLTHRCGRQLLCSEPVSAAATQPHAHPLRSGATLSEL